MTVTNLHLKQFFHNTVHIPTTGQVNYSLTQSKYSQFQQTEFQE